MSYKQDCTTIYTINGRKYQVTAPALFDSKTNKQIPDDKLDDNAIKIARQMYRDDMGLISPEDLKKYRSKVGISQRDLAEITGLSPNTIALYEAGEFPTVANNRMLKSLFNNDDILKEYFRENENQYSDSIKEKIRAYLSGTKINLKISSDQPKFKAVQLANWFRVNNYFARKFDYNVDPITQMQVVKLLYFAYGRFLAKNNKRLFSSPILHLQYGPVVEEVHQRFRGMVVLDPDKPDKQAFEDYNLVSSDVEISNLLQKIDEDYSDYTASGLSRITHRAGSPWSMTEKGKPIEDQLIFDQFTRTEEQVNNN